MKGTKLVLILLAAAVAASGVLAAGAAEKAEFTYVGVKSCKMCHKKDATGNQFAVWEASPHAKAYATLASDKAKEQAKAAGIEDPQKSEKCLKCHVTAFPVMGDEAAKITLEEGVSCESCHGPGSGYKKLKVMKAVRAGETEAASVGLTLPDEKVCKTCHTPEGNPNYKEFKFEEFVKKIAHPIPEGK